MARSAPAVAFRTLGCKVNQVEAETIAASLIGSGAVVVPEEDADVVVVTTCTVTGEADHKARKAVRHAHALPQRPIVVVTGCLAALDDGTLVALGDRVVVEADKAAVAARVAALMRLRATSVSATRAGGAFHTRAMVKVEDGCDNFCAYCIVPHARGVPRSVALEAIVAEVEALGVRGAREVVLTGINIGRYDDAAVRLPGLIRAVAATGIERIRVSSIEPEHVDEDLLAAIAETPAFCEHLHVPLQSGCDRTLAAMGRRYDTAAYETIVARAREAIPGFALSTDVIAGFPGETDVDAAQTLAFLERIGFSKLHVFRYSARAGTPAAGRADHVDPRVIAARAAAVRELGDRMRLAHLRSHIGDTLEVLVERSGKGVARDGSRVRFSSAIAPPGELVSVGISGVDERGSALTEW
ncbi:MAG: MiaB/RimO family radical SAM methylthiotransferase [Coriobacteriia bacterium]